jgi:hypothetical protein
LHCKRISAAAKGARMKKFLALLALVFLVFVVIYRQRIFLWDPLATVTRDGVKQGDVRVMIDYSNDVLVDDKSTDTRRLYLVQHWNEIAQFSTGPLKCVQFLACMTDAEHATGQKVTPGARGSRKPFDGVTMTNKQVEFVDESGALVSISLR